MDWLVAWMQVFIMEHVEGGGGFPMHDTQLCDRQVSDS